MVERSNYHKLSFDLHTHTVTPESTYTQINNVIDRRVSAFPVGKAEHRMHTGTVNAAFMTLVHRDRGQPSPDRIRFYLYPLTLS